MAIYITPKTARYKNKTLLFNLTETMFQVTEESVADGYDIGFIFSEFTVYVELDPGLRFGVLDHDTKETYGPYDTALKVVQKHIFGKYDSMLTFLTERISFNEEVGAYGILLPGMYYHRGSFNLGSNLPKTAKSIAAMLPRLDRDFVFSLDSTTFFAEGSVELFLNRLNIMFNRDNFKEDYKEGNFYSAGALSRAAGTAIEQSNGNRFFVVNTSTRRHASYVIPKIDTIGFLDISSSSSSCDYVIDHYIDSVEDIIETNETEVEYFLDILGQDLTSKTFTYSPLSLFDNIKFIIFPTESVRTGYYFIKIFDGTIKIVEFDAFTKTMVIYDETKAVEISGMMADGSISINGSTITFIHSSEDFTAENSPSVKMAMHNFKWAVYDDTNQVLNEDGNIYSFQFAKNLLRTIFSGE